MGFSMTDWTILALVALALFAGNQFRYWHRLPWVGPMITTETGELRRVPAYVYGMAWILGGLALWCSQHPAHWPAFGFALAVAIAAGLGTTLPRMAERDAELQDDSADKEELEAAWLDQERKKRGNLPS